MRGRAHVHIIRICKTSEASRGRSRDRTVGLPRDCRVVQIKSPHVGKYHGGRIMVTMEGITVYLEKIVRDLNCIDKERLHLWSAMCSHGQFSVTCRHTLMMTSTAPSFKRGKIKGGGWP
eukprot:5009369-Pyramimonas_sp.AAC.1